MQQVSLAESGEHLLIKVSRADILLSLRQKRWNKKEEAFETLATLANMRKVAGLVPLDVWSEEAKQMLAAAEEVDEARERNAHLATHREEIDISDLSDICHGEYSPYTHQLQALKLAQDLPEYAYFMQMGTGKTLTAILDACHQFREDRIDLAIVVCPNSVKTNWCNPEKDGKDELRTHMASDVDWTACVWMTPETRKYKASRLEFERSLMARRPKLHWLVVNVEALGTSRAQEYLQYLCEQYRVMMIVDESTRIKTPKAIRTKTCLSLARYTRVRRIMSGSPVIKAPEHAWAQLRFLGPDAMPYESVTAFKNRFMDINRPQGYRGPEIVEGYKNLEELTHLINRVSFRVLKDECLDLPDKVYHKARVTMTKEQAKAYEEMRKRAFVILEDHGTEVTATIVLVQLLRLSQIASGFLPVIDPDTGKAVDIAPLCKAEENPKFKEALQIIEETEGKLIVWGHYTAQLQLFSSLLTAKGINHVRFDGSVSDADRVTARTAFQEDPDVKIFLGNPAAGGIGLTLTAAEGAIYLSNSFKTEDRVQSEDRCHRAGSERHHTINYHDVITDDTVDEKVLAVLRSNKKLSDAIMGVAWKDWI